MNTSTSSPTTTDTEDASSFHDASPLNVFLILVAALATWALLIGAVLSAWTVFSAVGRALGLTS